MQFSVAPSKNSSHNKLLSLETHAAMFHHHLLALAPALLLCLVRSPCAAVRVHNDAAAAEPAAAARTLTVACGVGTLLGCFNDTGCQGGGCVHPVLPRYQSQLHDKVTREACAFACNDLHLTVGGIDAGNHCFCGTCD